MWDVCVWKIGSDNDYDYYGKITKAFLTVTKISKFVLKNQSLLIWGKRGNRISKFYSIAKMEMT